MSDYKATPEQWARIKQRQLGGNDLVCAVLELRVRVEALEAANYARHIDIIRLANAVANQISDRTKFFADVTPDDDDCQLNEEADIVDYYAALAAQHQGQAVFHEDPKPTPNSSQIRSSLVERVSAAIHPDRCADPNLYLHEARAAIREVAAWMTSNPDVYFPPALVFALEQEAER
jgi:hypothetical protein